MFYFHHVAITVKEIKTSEKFYAIFGFSRVHHFISEKDGLEISHLKLNDLIIELFCYNDATLSRHSFNPSPIDLQAIGIKHIAFKVQSLTVAKQFFSKNGLDSACEITKGRTGVDYFFIKDPDGNFVEIVQDERSFL